jgi:ComEC/Rec2-related protein
MLLVGGTNLAAFRAYVFLLVSNTLKLLGVRLSKLSKFVLGVLLILVFIPHAYADIGFQLSVISWSLLNLIPAGRLISKFSIIPEIARDEVLMAFFGSFILFPVSLLYFKEYNLASLVANTIVGPLFSILSLVLMGIFPVSLISSGYFVEKLINLVNSGVVLIYRLIGDFSGLEFVVKDGDFVSGIIYIVFFGVTSYFIYKGIYKYASKECIQDFYI